MENAALATASPVVGAGEAAAESATTQRGRAAQRRLLRAEADRLRYALDVLAECDADVPELVHGSGDDELVRSLAGGEIACTLGISLSAARDVLWLAERLTNLMPSALEAMDEARLDLPRVRVLAEATMDLDDATARSVSERLIAALDAPVWDGPSPRAWRQRVRRAIVRADQDAAARRRQRALAARRVSAWAQDDGMGVLQVRADALDIALIDTVLTDLAAALPGVDPTTGEVITVDQRRADACVALFRAVSDHAPLPQVPVRRVHDLGLVLHADTLYDDGPRASATAELRGLGAPTPLAASSARELARRQLGHGTTVQVLVVDDSGALAHVVRLTDTSVVSARHTLLGAVRGTLAHPPPHATDRYRPTAAISRHVLAEASTCSFYDCARRSRSCDLDNDDPWPRGPTSVTNLDPKCRRHHQAKTHALVHSALHAGPGRGPRHVSWTLRTGIQVTTRPEPLPGCDWLSERDAAAPAPPSTACASGAGQ
jgi:hypothetical protein